MSQTAAVTNADVGRRIGLAHSTVSRIRSGDRIPSLDVFLVIEDVYGWSLVKQVQARQLGPATYAKEFEKKLVEKYGAFSDLAAPVVPSVPA